MFEHTDEAVEINVLKEDLKQLRQDFNTLNDDLQQKGSEGIEALQASIKEKSKASYEHFEEGVKKNPLVALLTAFGVGALIAKLL